MNEFRIRNLLLIVSGLFIIFAADHLGVFAGLNTYCYNLAFRFRGPVKPSGDIVIAAIDEKTRGKLVFHFFDTRFVGVAEKKADHAIGEHAVDEGIDDGAKFYFAA